MSDQCVGEIRMFAGNYAPTGWALCNGAALPITNYQALFALLGTTYGGDGKSTFNLPDLRSRLPIGSGTTATGTVYNTGMTLGTENVVLTQAQMPSHNHVLMASSDPATSGGSTGTYLAAPVDTDGGTNQDAHYLSPAVTSIATLSLHENTVTSAGLNVAHSNVMPCFGINFIISLNGVFPSLQ